MSSGFFARHRKESHNRPMTDRHSQKLSYPLRMPDELRDRIAASAKKHNRSMNAEIVSVLQAHYGNVDGLTFAMENKADEKMAIFMKELGNVMRPHLHDLLLKHGVLQELAKQSLEQDDPENKP
jgi:hypothetical protein